MRLLAAISLLVLGPHLILCEEQLWEKDASNDVYIEASREGFESVTLKCLPEDEMEVEVKLEEDFDGVFYTRGSYSEAKPPCYLDADGGTTIKLKFGLNECKTKTSKDGNTKVRLILNLYYNSNHNILWYTGIFRAIL